MPTSGGSCSKLVAANTLIQISNLTAIAALGVGVGQRNRYGRSQVVYASEV